MMGNPEPFPTISISFLPISGLSLVILDREVDYTHHNDHHTILRVLKKVLEGRLAIGLPGKRKSWQGYPVTDALGLEAKNSNSTT